MTSVRLLKCKHHCLLLDAFIISLWSHSDKKKDLKVKPKIRSVRGLATFFNLICVYLRNSDPDSSCDAISKYENIKNILPDRPFHNFGASKSLRCTTFPNYTKFAGLLTLRLQNCKKAGSGIYFILNNNLPLFLSNPNIMSNYRSKKITEHKMKITLPSPLPTQT